MLGKSFASATAPRPGLVGSLALATALVALTAFAQPVSAKTLKWASQGDLNSADQYMRNQTLSLSILSNVYEGLIRRDPKTLAIEPALAEKWEIAEPTRWRFYLRKGVKFHDGKPFTADDVVFSAQRAMSKGSELKGRLPGVKEVKKIDDHTVDFITEKPNPILHVEWSTWGIYSKAWAIDNKSTEVSDPSKGEAPNFATTHANGTGPFKLKSREADVKTVFEVNPDWWGKDKYKHNVTEVIFTPIKSAQTRVAALISGQIDFMEPVPVQDIDTINKNKGTKVLVSPETRVIFLGFDHPRKELKFSSVKGKNPFQDKRVRQAFMQAIDIQTIKTKVMRNMALPSAMMVAKGFAGWDEAYKRLPYNPDAAKKLLAEAGYPNGFEVQMDCPNDRYVNDEGICQATVGMLQRIGIKINLVTKTNTVLFGEYTKFETSFYMLGWAPGSYDSWNPLQFLHRCVPIDAQGNSKPGGTFNYGRYCNPKVDALIDQIGQETDLTKRNALLKQAWTTTIDDVAYIPLHQQMIAWGVRDTIAKMEAHAGNEFLWYHVMMK